jgi:gamma-glutamyltranspeptidase / glutathione hydrolase
MLSVKEGGDPESRGAQHASRRHSGVRAEAAAATAFPLATDTALEVLRAGGNAVDAAIAAAWALCVCEPSASGVGGQTTLLLYRADGTARVIDGHSYAPKGVSLDVVTESQQRNGYRSCTIPSTPSTLEYARQKYGVLSREHLLESAIRIAEEGYAITPLQHRQTRWVASRLRDSEQTARLFLHDGAPPQPGAIFRQPILARTLRRLAEEGIEDFYQGSIARFIVEDMRQNNGLLDGEDLADCHLPVEREALRADYLGYEVLSAPPPGGGLQVLLTLRFLEALAPGNFSREPEEWHEAIALAIYSVFRERENSPLNREEVTHSQMARILDRDRVRRLAVKLKEEGTPVDETLSGVEEPGDTTHLTVADSKGNVVALTQSIQSVFGAKVANGWLGFLYNNYLRTCPRHPHPCQLGSLCQPRSNVAPTVVLKKGNMRKVPVMALGGAGSRRTVSAIVQVISAVIDRGLGIAEAVAAPRVHALLSKDVWIENPACSEKLLKKLEGRFLNIKSMPAHSYRLGSVQGLQWLQDGNVQAAADPRRDGTARVLAR